MSEGNQVRDKREHWGLRQAGTHVSHVNKGRSHHLAPASLIPVVLASVGPLLPRL